MNKELEFSGRDAELPLKTLPVESSPAIVVEEVQVTDESKRAEPVDDRESELNQADAFDLDAFFQVNEEAKNSTSHTESAQVGTTFSVSSPEGTERAPSEPQTVLFTLRDDAEQVIASFSATVTASRYEAGAKMTSEAFSLLGILAQSCGAFCMHGAHMLSSVSSAGGVGLPSVSSMAGGKLHVDGHIDSVSSATGLSRSRLLTNNFSLEEAMGSMYEMWQGLLKVNLGFVEMFAGSLFHAFRPDGNNQSSSDWSGAPAGAGV